jgi:hypothetical protein
VAGLRKTDNEGCSKGFIKSRIARLVLEVAHENGIARIERKRGSSIQKPDAQAA